MLTLLQSGLCLADGLILQNGRFGEKEYGESIYFTLTKEQSENIPKNGSEFFASTVKLNKEQQDFIFQKTKIQIKSIFLFDSKKGYNDCTCGGIPANLASLIDSTKVQLPRCFIRDEYMESRSKELSNFNVSYDKNGTLVVGQTPCSQIQLEGTIGTLPVTMQLSIPTDKTSIIHGEYTYQSGEYKGQVFTLFGKQANGQTFTIREYEQVKHKNTSHSYNQQTAEFLLTKKDKLLGKDKFHGILTNNDGTKYSVDLHVVKTVAATTSR